MRPGVLLADFDCPWDPERVFQHTAMAMDATPSAADKSMSPVRRVAHQASRQWHRYVEPTEIETMPDLARLSGSPQLGQDRSTIKMLRRVDEEASGLRNNFPGRNPPPRRGGKARGMIAAW
jgi:hypothetical protein